MTKDTYEGVTQVPGSHKRCWNGINLMLDASLPLDLKTIALQVNKHEIFQFKQYCETKGIVHHMEPQISPRINRDKISVEYGLSPEEAAQLAFEYGGGDMPWGRRKKENNFCAAGTVSAYITSTGEMQCCALYRGYNQSSETDLRKNSFDKVWKTLHHSPKFPKEKKCLTCHSFKYCFQCPARAFLSTGRQDRVDDFMCRFSQTIDKCANQKINQK
jgi:MoaA/NifB/PqqE/SkfB family radical SAM enzyme